VNARLSSPPSVFPRAVQAASKVTEIALNDWILASPATRAVWGLDHSKGLWRIGLSVDAGDGRFERLPAAQHADYGQCVANAIEIARLAGYR
jgi:hypothetical protein